MTVDEIKQELDRHYAKRDAAKKIVKHLIGRHSQESHGRREGQGPTHAFDRTHSRQEHGDTARRVEAHDIPLGVGAAGVALGAAAVGGMAGSTMINRARMNRMLPQGARMNMNPFRGPYSGRSGETAAVLREWTPGRGQGFRPTRFTDSDRFFFGGGSPPGLRG